MNFFRNHIVFRCLWLVMALHVLNCSVDTPDAQPESIPEDLSYNDMESVVEILLEKILDWDNAISEYEENDIEGPGKINLKKGVDFSYFDRSLNLALFIEGISNNRLITYINTYANQFHPELSPPPPKA